jgi:hypothetical protein
VATRDGAFDAAGWRAATRDLSPALGRPIVLGAQEIPRTATGKVQRALLAGLVAERDRGAAVPASEVRASSGETGEHAP